MDRRSFLAFRQDSAAQGFRHQSSRRPGRRRARCSIPMSPGDRARRPSRATTTSSVRNTELKLRCTCGCTLDVFTCRTTDFTCTYSPALHREVVDLFAEGKTSEAVIAAFVDKYGEKILMAPKPEGFNLAGYVVPGAAILAVGGIVAWIIRRRVRLSRHRAVGWRGRGPSGRSSGDERRARAARTGAGGDGKVIWLEAAAAALVGVALLLVVLGPLISRELVPAIVDDEPQDLEETPKGIALSALKEIEFDQATGKLSDEDYAMLKGKYTAQALEAPCGPRMAAAGPGDLEAVIAARARAIRAQGSSDSDLPALRAAARAGCALLFHLRLRAWRAELRRVRRDPAARQPFLRPVRDARRRLIHPGSGLPVAVRPPVPFLDRKRPARLLPVSLVVVSAGVLGARGALSGRCLGSGLLLAQHDLDPVRAAIVPDRNGGRVAPDAVEGRPCDPAAVVLRIEHGDLVARAADPPRERESAATPPGCTGRS